MKKQNPKLEKNVAQTETQNKIRLFDKMKIRIAFDEKKDKAYFCVPDVVCALRDGKDPKDYIKKLRTRRDRELGEQWEKLVKILPCKTSSGVQKIRFADAKGIERIIKKVYSVKKDAFQKWIEKMQNLQA